ncbi:homeobox protein H2.0 [Bactrocera dorsalis]|uniref:Homeobox protein H2.0 n=1 Tax=Bactrocera dorsalis TaxID=27457 RepID=A0A6I9V2E0_BACDO|nr:homeobox protein H2.0 [Bactrocera dorsalis]
MGVLEIDQRLSTIMESAPTNLTIEKPVASDVLKCAESIEEMHVEFTKSLEIDKNNGENSNASKLPLPVGETKIQLSFSVDRLLNIEEAHTNGGSSANQESNEVCESGKNSNTSVVKCFDGANMCAYGSCTDPNCAALLGAANDMQLDNTSRNLKKYSVSALTNEMQEKFYRQMPSLAPPYLDFKAIVRPTPIRVVNNGRETVQLHAPYSALATSALLRFQQQQQQKSIATHAQILVNSPGMLQNLSGTGVGSAVSLGLKSFHNPTMNMQNFAPPTLSVRFPTLKTHAHHLLDIPMSTASLMNHHRQHHPHHGTQTTSLTSSHAVASNTSPQLQLTTASGSSISMSNGNNSGTSASGSSGGSKRKRSWSRAVFSNLQRKGLEIQFQQQKYITKPDRRKLAARLNLTDAQVKVWFQNRRMKWRHTRENLKSGQEKQIPSASTSTAASSHKPESSMQATNDEKHIVDGYSSDDSSYGELSENEDEIDVVQ